MLAITSTTDSTLAATIMGGVRKIGHAFDISTTLLGHGSYGDVFLAHDEYGNELAAKCCKMQEDGIPNILEASIMATMVHPNLNRAVRIQGSSDKLYILQDRAQTDLAQYTRRDKVNHKATIEELRLWCFAISEAVAALHRESIIHADIKASNVLMYDDGTVKLTDFTLATKKWRPDETFTHNACTCTHRPVECLLKDAWDESLDVWSLACTFYEIAYGELLFPYQGSFDKGRAKDRFSKQRLTERSVNVIIDWANRGLKPENYIARRKYALEYRRYQLCEEYYSPEKAVFNDLVCKMLHIDPRKRLTIFEVLRHPFFTGLSPKQYLSIIRPINKLAVSEHARVLRHLQLYTPDETVQKLALNIYARCNDLNTTGEQVKAATCAWIASKLVLGFAPNLAIATHHILSTEREICHNVAFRLHIL
jgi:serine/threonine protein kinase